MEKKESYLYELFKIILIEIFLISVSIILGYFLIEVGLIDEVDYYFISGILIAASFHFGRNYQKLIN